MVWMVLLVSAILVLAVVVAVNVYAHLQPKKVTPVIPVKAVASPKLDWDGVDRRVLRHDDGEWSPATRRAYLANSEEKFRAAEAGKTIDEWRARERFTESHYPRDTEYGDSRAFGDEK